MKSAEEWRKSRYFGNNSKDGIETIIQQIQLDAAKAVASWAANKIRREIELCGCNGIDRAGCESCNAKENSRVDIIAAANSLKLEDLK